MVASIVMVTGKLIFGFILGNIASTLANAESERVSYDEKLRAVKVLWSIEFNVDLQLKHSL